VKFNDVIGLAGVKQQLTELVQHNRLSHALLFIGKEGNGALALALALAQYVVCDRVNGKAATAAAGPSLFGEEPAPVPAGGTATDSCGECPSCRKAAQLIHPDIHYSYPTVTRKGLEKPVATDFIQDWRQFIQEQPYGNGFDWIEKIKERENSQGKITAHECEDILRKLNLKSFESGYKILVMWMPEELDKEGNKLLKIIEEPPPQTLFILVTEHEEQVLPTILSRCQLIRVPALTHEEITAALVAREQTDPAIARQVAGIADGSYREALQLIQQAGEDWQRLLRDWLNAMLKTGPVAQVKWVEEISRLGREKQKQFLRYFNHLLQQAVRQRYLGDALPLADNERDFVTRINRLAGPEQQEAIIRELDQASYYIERNAHGKMLFHALTIKLYHIIQDKIVFLMD
jgi:DNA polymerase-3 subunit delta'